MRYTTVNTTLIIYKNYNSYRNFVQRFGYALIKHIHV